MKKLGINMLLSLNRQLEKWMPIITPLSVLLGVLFYSALNSLSFLVPYIFALITFSNSLSIDVKQVVKVLFTPYKLTVYLVISHLIVPGLAFLFGSIFFKNDPLIITGIVLAFLIPTAIASLMWVSIYKGNSPLTITIVFLHTLLSPIYIPAAVYYLFNTKVSLDTWGIFSGLIGMVILPLIVCLIGNHLTSGKLKRSSVLLSPLSKFGLMFIIAVNSSVVRPYIVKGDLLLFEVMTLVLFIAMCSYLIGYGAAKGFRMNNEDQIAFMYTCGMRNIGVGSSLAIIYFPPLVALPVIIGTLFQQILASTAGIIVKKYHTKKGVSQNSQSSTMGH